MLSSGISSKASKLQTYYFINFEVGLIATLLVFLGLFKLPINTDTKSDLQFDESEVVKMEEIVQTKQPDKAPPPPRPVVPVAVPNDELITEEVITFDSELNLDEALEVSEQAPTFEVENSEDKEEDDIFVIVEKMPVLIGGIKSVQEKIEYPELALKAGIEGRVIVQFVINEQGLPENPKVIRGIGGGCDEEALRVVKTLKFEPGLQRGKPVKIRYTLPITFDMR